MASQNFHKYCGVQRSKIPVVLLPLVANVPGLSRLVGQLILWDLQQKEEYPVILPGSLFIDIQAWLDCSPPTVDRKLSSVAAPKTVVAHTMSLSCGSRF